MGKFALVNILIATFLALAGQALARTWYVSSAALTGGNGSLSSPYASMQDAEEKTNPGDTVSVMNGTYKNVDTVGNVVTIHRSGTPSQWIIFRAFPGHHPFCKFNGPNGIHVASARYIVVDGFEVQGNADNVTYDTAWSHRTDLNDPFTTGTGVSVNDYFDSIPSFVIIRNCVVYKCSGGGINTVHADHVTIENNVVHHCTFWSPYAPSGISCYEARDVDADTGVKIIIRANVSHHNENMIPFYYELQKITDGNGIIIDDSKNTQVTGGVPYHGRFLVQNNVVYANGGAGILVYRSKKAVVSNNTSYFNGHTPTLTGEIFPNLSDSVVFANNILCAAPGKKINNNWSSTAVYCDYNVYNRDSGIDLRGAHSIVADPLFSRADTAGNPDFHLLKKSPAIDAGVALYAPDIDADGRVRPQGNGIDIGAYEWTSERIMAPSSRDHASKASPVSGKTYLLNGRELKDRTSRRSPVTAAAGRTVVHLEY